jgi:hypothetical protein
MTDFLKKYKAKGVETIKTELAEAILNELAEQLYKEWKAEQIFPFVATSQAEGDGYMIVSLKLMSGNEEKQYYYNLVEVKQPLDKEYEIEFRAFHNPPTTWKVVSSPSQFRDELVEIMGDPRVKIVKHMIAQMGNTIRTWIEEKDRLK